MSHFVNVVWLALLYISFFDSLSFASSLYICEKSHTKIRCSKSKPYNKSSYHQRHLQRCTATLIKGKHEVTWHDKSLSSDFSLHLDHVLEAKSTDVLSSTHSNHMVAHNHCYWDLMPSCRMEVYRQEEHSVHKKID